MIKKIDWWWVGILVVAAMVRLVGLGRVPDGLLWDEAALGYNAWSVWQTGRDEYGKLLPLVFKSFGDYKPGLYVYLVAPLAGVLGLSEAAVRLPAAISGVVGVGLIYILAGQLWGGRKTVARMAAVVAAVSPWQVFFSRQSWEVGVMTTLLLGGVIMFCKMQEAHLRQDCGGQARNKKYWWLVLSGVLLGLTFWTYQGAKLLTPALVAVLVWVFRQEVRKMAVKGWMAWGVPMAVLALPIGVGLLGGMGGRLEVMSIFSYKRGADEVARLASEVGVSSASLTYQVFHGDVVFYLRNISSRYLHHFSPRFLFFEGDWQNLRHGVPYMGQMYLVEIVFLIVGGAALVRKPEKRDGLVWGWLLLAPVAAALTRDEVQAVRALPMVVPLALISGRGAGEIVRWVKGGWWRKAVGVGLLGFWLWQVSYFVDLYAIHAKFRNAATSQYGYREAVQLIKQEEEQIDKVIFTVQYGQPYIFYLFYSGYPPAKYQQEAELAESEVGDVGQVERVGKVEFRPIYWPADRNLANSLFVGDEYALPLSDVESAGAKVMKEIYFPDGKLAFRIVKTQTKNE